MPIFDFECKQCGHRFEALVLKSMPVCPECKSEQLEKLLSLPAVTSETTRELAMKAAKKRDKAQGTEREWAQRQYELHHDD